MKQNYFEIISKLFRCFISHVTTSEIGEWSYYNFAAGSFHTKKLCSRLYSTQVDFKNRFLSHPLGDLEVTYALHLQLVEKPVVDFLFVIIELFGVSFTVETL